MVAKNYTINFVDPAKSAINVLPGLITGPTGSNRQTDIDLIGMGHSLWGEVMLENILHILENFSSEEDIHTITAITTDTFTIDGDVTLAFPVNRSFNIWGSTSNDGSYVVSSSVYVGAPTYKTTVTIAGSPGLVAGSPTEYGVAGELGVPNKSTTFSPTTPVEGQLWYNQTQGQLYAYGFIGSPLTGTWKRVGGITFSATQPASASTGDMWWETTSYAITTDEYGRNLQIYTGSAWVRVAENYLPRDGSKAMQGTLDMGTNLITGVADPTDPTHVGDRAYNDGRYILSDGTVPASGILNMNGFRIENLGSPISGDDAVSLNYLDGNYLDLLGTNPMTGTLDMGNHYITNVLDPVDATQVGDRGYNDNRYLNREAAGDYMAGNLAIGFATVPTAPYYLHQHANTIGANYHWFTNTTTGFVDSTDGLLVGLDGSENAVFLNREATNTDFYTNNTLRLSISSGGTATFGSTPYVSSNKIWHAGNGGTGSGLDADKLDGLEATDFLQSSKVHYSQLRHGLNQEFASHALATYILPPTTGYYFVYAYGATAYSGSQIDGPRLYYGTTSSSTPIYTTLLANDIIVNRHAGNEPLCFASVIYLTAGNYWRILLDAAYWAVDYTAIRLDHV
jgi:hypothetical protein